MCPLQLPKLVSIKTPRFTPNGTALSGISSPRTPSTHSTSNPVKLDVSAMASRLSVLSGSPTTKTLPKPKVPLATRLMSSGVDWPL